MNDTNISNGTSSTFNPIGIEEKYFNAFLLTTVMIITILGNSIALHAFFVTNELKRPTYYFIASLCISDILIATLSMPLWTVDVMLNWDSRFPTKLRTIYSTFDIFCGTWSIMSLAMISIERYICITYALHYWRIMTKRRFYYIFTFVFVYSSIVTGVNRLNYDNGTLSDKMKQSFIVLAAFVVPVLIKVFSYSKIYSEAQKHTNQINELKKMYKHLNMDDDTMSAASISIHKSVHSDSTASWTCSPIAGRKRQTTQNRILVLSDVDEEESSESKDSLKISAPIHRSRQTFTSTLCKLICSKKNEMYEVEYTTDNNGGKSTIKGGEKKPFLNGKKHNFFRQDTNDSIDSYNETSYYKKSKKRKRTDSSKSTVSKSLTSKSFEENDRIYCEVDSRKRSFSCPAPVSDIKKTRKSLDPNDAIIDKSTINDSKYKETTSPSLSRLSKAVRSFSKWSPSNSPLATRRNLHKNSNNNNTKNSQNRHLQRIRRFKKELRAAKVVALIMGTFFICWLPFMMAVIFHTFNLVEVNMRFIMITKDLHYLNSAINPVLYVVLNKVYRAATMKVIRNINIFKK